MTVNEIDIEDCVQSGCLAHNNTFHNVSSQEQHLIQDRLLDYYDPEKRTMPWRKPTRTDLDSKVNTLLFFYPQDIICIISLFLTCIIIIKALGQRAYEGI